MTLDEFRAIHLEFRTTPDALVQSKIDDATLSIAPDVYGPKTERAIELKAADLLARTPWGMSQRLVSDKGESVYARELRQLEGEIAVNIIVV